MGNTNIDIEVLNDLIQINNDRTIGYNKAMKELKPDDDDLKTIFAGMSRQSARLKSALSQEAQVSGKDP